MSSHHNQQFASQLHHLAAEFLSQRGTGESLITVLDFRLSPDGRVGTIVISAWPEDKREKALYFVEQLVGPLAHHLRRALPRRQIPTLKFQLSKLEANN